MSPYSSLTLNFLVEINEEGEGGTLANVWVKQNLTTEILSDLLRNVKSKSNSFGVELLRVVKKPEQFEQFVMVFLLDPNTCVWDRNFYHAESLRLLKIFMVLLVYQMLKRSYELACDCHRAFFRRKFEGIALQVQQNLLDSMHVWIHDKNIVEVLHLEVKADAREFRFIDLQIDYFLYGLF